MFRGLAVRIVLNEVLSLNAQECSPVSVTR